MPSLVGIRRLTVARGLPTAVLLIDAASVVVASSCGGGRAANRSLWRWASWRLPGKRTPAKCFVSHDRTIVDNRSDRRG